MNQKKSSKKSLIVIIAIIILGGAGYFYYQGRGAPATSTLDVTQSAEGAQVIALLNQIQGLRIDKTLFTDPGYLTLIDYTVPIPEQPVGRVNPFAPLPGVPSPPGTIGASTVRR
jgi:hypothetical protein